MRTKASTARSMARSSTGEASDATGEPSRSRSAAVSAGPPRYTRNATTLSLRGKDGSPSSARSVGTPAAPTRSRARRSSMPWTYVLWQASTTRGSSNPPARPAEAATRAASAAMQTLRHRDAIGHPPRSSGSVRRSVRAAACSSYSAGVQVVGGLDPLAPTHLDTAPGTADALLQVLDVTAAHSLDLAAQLEIAANAIVVEDAEAIDDRAGLAHGPDDLVGIEREVRRMAHGEHERVGSLHRLREVGLDAHVRELPLTVEETRLALARPRVAGLRLELPPVVDIGIVD